ncbi:hypothetical protein P154DRAFT_532366 [Amniculicola lignicola CBS 123094]|uniref:Uncharacterized protein n=1 Tax=Amniculicola lignicola CBS 123094 TaxID=1392246 RepID=A0A6A5WQA5_9PLEO|nr:hypothetical protein P154DRAFT_532366 [Amniculicola lignicola CBS 123094]
MRVSNPYLRFGSIDEIISRNMPLSQDDAAHILRVKTLLISQIKCMYRPAMRHGHQEDKVDIIFKKASNTSSWVAQAVICPHTQFENLKVIPEAESPNGPRGAIDLLWDQVLG